MSNSDPAEVTEADLAELERLEKAAPNLEAFGIIYKDEADLFRSARKLLPRLLAEVRRERAARREGAEAGLRKALMNAAARLDGLFQFAIDRGVFGVTAERREAMLEIDAALARPAEPDPCDHAIGLDNYGRCHRCKVKVNVARPDPPRATESERDRLVRERDAARKGLERLTAFVERNAPRSFDGDSMDCGCRSLAQDGRRCTHHTEARIARAALAQSGGGGGNP